MTPPRLLIVGAGSVGRRHARNLHALGALISCIDPRVERLNEVAKEVPLQSRHTTWEEALSLEADGVVIASPPSFHVDQSIAWLSRDVPVLLEKPVSPDLASAERLECAVESSAACLLLGYTYRWWPPLIELRERVAAGVVGPLRHARFVMSAHLADWHPWERYQDFFMASRELGGGALLDESHFLDLMVWLFGRPEGLSARVEHLSTLEITTDDNVDVLVVYPNNFRVTIHLDLYGRPHEKSVTVVGERGTLQCAFDPSELRHSSETAGNWRTTPFACERNDMFMGVARSFLHVLQGGTPECSVRDGINVLRLVELARLSSREQRTVTLAEVPAVAGQRI